MQFKKSGLHSGKSLAPYFARSLSVFLITALSSFFKSLGWRACRFYPSCSVYAREAYAELSFWKATFVSLKRFFSCHPFSPGGYHPLQTFSKKKDC